MKNKFERTAVIREGLYSLTTDSTEALILNQFIYWSERISDKKQYLIEENKRKHVKNMSNSELTHGFIYKSATELKGEIMSEKSVNTISRKLSSLVKKGFLTRRKNPKNAYDRTYQYRVNQILISKELEKLGFNPLDYLVNLDCLNYIDTKSSEIADKSNSHNVKSCYQVDNSKCLFDKAIPEITSKNTSKITSSSLFHSSHNSILKDDDDKIKDYIISLHLEELAHKDMVPIIKKLLTDIFIESKVVKEKVTSKVLYDTFSFLTPGSIDEVIDRYLLKVSTESVKNAENFLKVSLYKKAQTNMFTALAKRSGTTNIHCGNPSFDISDYSRLSVQRLMAE